MEKYASQTKAEGCIFCYTDNALMKLQCFDNVGQMASGRYKIAHQQSLEFFGKPTGTWPNLE